jgi:pancreatic triacylglycerol lipase
MSLLHRFMPPIGHANFYPAFGRDQTGCGVDLVGICSHSRAYLYYAESITGAQRFLARACSSFEEISGGFCTPSGDIAVMGGEPGNQDLKGQFWLPVNSNTPFATGSV